MVLFARTSAAQSFGKAVVYRPRRAFPGGDGHLHLSWITWTWSDFITILVYTLFIYIYIYIMCTLIYIYIDILYLNHIEFHSNHDTAIASLNVASLAHRCRCWSREAVVDGPEDSVFSAYREFLTVIGGSPRAARSREGCLSKARGTQRGTRRGTRGARGIQGGLTWWFVGIQLEQEKWWKKGEFETTQNVEFLGFIRRKWWNLSDD